ncbi:MAG: hypothetical protein AB7U85_10065 [Alphaproteobacteria bacterium]
MPNLADAKDGILIKNRYKLLSDKRIPDFDTPSAKAFEVADLKNSSGHPLFALVCNPKVLPRYSLIRSIRNFNQKGLIPYIEHDTVFFPPEDRNLFVVVYEKPLGGKVMPDTNSEISPINELDFINNLAKPLVSALYELDLKGESHRAIRPNNLFYMDKDKKEIVLGDCITASPGYDQPAFCEPIESIMCHPEGRGPGKYNEDLYAFGVTVFTLISGRNKLSRLSDSQILDLKIERGSYSAIVGDTKVSLGMIEFLKGVLADNIEQRWTIKDVELWVNGRRLSPIQSKADKRASAPFSFDNKDYYTARLLAIALLKNHEGAIEIIKNGKLEVWLKRCLQENKKADQIKEIVEEISARENNIKSQNDIILAKVCMLLDPKAPIRYKTVSTTVEGFGFYLFKALAVGENIKPLVEIIQRNIVQDWYAVQEKYVYASKFASLRNYIDREDLGFGIERCLYELCEYAPCLSKIIDHSYILDVGSIVEELDKVAKKQDYKSWPIDRHIIAFVSAHCGNKVESYLISLNSSNPSEVAVGLLGMISFLQWHFHRDPLYNLTSWVGSLMAPVIKRYHSRVRRKIMEKEIHKLVRKGLVYDLFSFLDNNEEITDDAKSFARAKQEYAAAEKEIYNIENRKKEREEDAITFGHQVAAITSFGVAVITILIMFISKF